MNKPPSHSFPFWAWLIPLGLTLVLVVIIWLSKPHHAPSIPPALELNRTNLVRSHEQWYQTGRTNPFTGVLVEYYPQGGLMSRSVVSNGQLDGLSEGWFTNQQIQIRETYRTNVSDGLRTRWYPNGQKLSEAMIVQGQIQGTFRHWHIDGTLAEEIPMQAGRQEGVGRAYYPSGFLREELNLHDGKTVSQQEWKDGERKANWKLGV